MSLLTEAERFHPLRLLWLPYPMHKVRDKVPDMHTINKHPNTRMGQTDLSGHISSARCGWVGHKEDITQWSTNGDAGEVPRLRRDDSQGGVGENPHAISIGLP